MRLVVSAIVPPERFVKKNRGQDRSCPRIVPQTLVESLHRLDVSRLQALRALDDVELDGSAFGEGAETATLDGGEVDEHVVAVLGGDEAEALGVVKPLDITSCSHRESPFCAA